MAVSFGGLASGIDTNSIIEQLLALERRPQLRLERQERQMEARQALLREIASRLRGVRSAAADLRSAATWAEKQTVSSSDPTRVEARLTGSAGIGGYQLEVTQLARAEQRTYAYTASTSATQITIDGVTVDIAAGATVQEVADAINNATGSPVYASAVNGELVLSSRQTGAANGFTASGSTIAEDPTRARVGLDALYTLDGVAGSSASNVVSGAIAGVELTLKAVTSGAITVNVTAPATDTALVESKVKAFVDRYNEAVDLIRSKVEERRIAEPSNRVEETKGLLQSDSMLTGLLSQLRIALSDPVAGNPSNLDELAEIGVSTGATTGDATLSTDAVKGRLVLDTAKLGEALAADPAAVERLLAGDGTTEGLATRLERIIDQVAGAGQVIDSRLTSGDAQLSRLRTAIGDMERRLSRRESVLVAQFAAMEKALQASQAQGMWLSGQLAALQA